MSVATVTPKGADSGPPDRVGTGLKHGWGVSPGRQQAIVDTLHGLVHYAVAATAFLSVTLAMLVQSWGFRRDAYWRRHFTAASVLAVITFIALAVYVLWRALPRGASEKLVILLIVLWLLLTTRWLMLTQPKGGTAA